ncbi:MAG: histidine phosphatase family protein [Clostridia bacterium]|nr:histidine phosphatase family protein [Clostridia bacterium]
MYIYIIRHGETKANEEGMLQGWMDEKLNESGVLLAELTGKGLKGTKFDICFSSDLSRARDTAAILLRESGNDCEIIEDRRLRELDMGDYQGKRFKGEKTEVDLDIVNTYFDEPRKLKSLPGGESIEEFISTQQEFLKEVARMDYESVLISSHGCAVRAMLNFLYEDPSDFWQGRVPYNCAISVVEVKDDEMKLIVNDRIYYDRSYIVDRYAK